MTTSEAYAVCKRNGVNVAHGSLLAQEIAPVLAALELSLKQADQNQEAAMTGIAILEEKVATLEAQRDAALIAMDATTDMIVRQVEANKRLQAELQTTRNLLDMSLAENQRLRANMDGMLAEREDGA